MKENEEHEQHNWATSMSFPKAALTTCDVVFETAMMIGDANPKAASMINDAVTQTVSTIGEAVIEAVLIIDDFAPQFQLFVEMRPLSCLKMQIPRPHRGLMMW
jgi:hypothetical protein